MYILFICVTGLIYIKLVSKVGSFMMIYDVSIELR